MMQSFLPIIASASTDYPPLWQIILYLAGMLFFLLLNAFFVAAEFSIVKVRPSQVETAAKLKPRRAQATRELISNLDPYLSACQLGITIASLALGFPSTKWAKDLWPSGCRISHLLHHRYHLIYSSPRHRRRIDAEINRHPQITGHIARARATTANLCQCFLDPDLCAQWCSELDSQACLPHRAR